MKLFIGLGNPGPKYKNTRHNAGFLALDEFARLAQVDIDKSDFKSLYTVFVHNGEKIYLVKPQTFMNLSGEALVMFLNFYKIDIADVVVIYDDMDLAPGNIRIKKEGSSGGQKGIQNIITLTGTSNIARIRIGIGKPLYDGVDHVLDVPREEELVLFKKGIELAASAIKDILLKDIEFAMKKYNVKEKKIQTSE